jgi:hypothetical protein
LFSNTTAIPQSRDVTQVDDTVKAALAQRSHYRGATCTLRFR